MRGMKKWIIGSCLLLASCAPSTTGVVAARQAPVVRDVFPAGYDAAEACASVQLFKGYAAYTLPARFPDPVTDKQAHGDFRLNCPAFTVVRIDDKSLTVMGLTPAELDAVLDRSGNEMRLGMWEYTRLDMATPGVLRTVTRDGTSVVPRSGLVIAVRQPGGALMPLVFNGQATEVKYDSTRPVEVFSNAESGSYSEFNKVTIDTPNKTITFEDTPFPKP